MRSKKAIINIISSLTLQLVTIICGFIVPRLIIETFGSSVNGLVTSVTQFLAYITLLESGFGPVVKSILYKPIANKNKKEIERILKASEKFFRIISYIFIAYIVVLCFALPVIVSNELDKLFTLSLVIIISISTFAEYYFGMTYKLYLQAEQKTYVTSIIQIGITMLNTIMIVLLIYFESSIQIVKLASAVIFVLRPIIQNLYVKKKYNISLKNVENNYIIKQKWDGLAQHIAAVIHNNTDVVIITLFMNTIEVSVYSVYLMVINGIRNLMQSINKGVDASFGDMLAKGEKESLNNGFKIYELFYITITTVVFTITLLVILPFISVYTKGITDANYYRPTFAYLIVIAELLWAIRQPYNDLVKTAGHFKETMKGAWVECGVNIVLSVILVFKYGIVGVAIGTLVAMIIRTIEFMYHTSKYILDRSILYTFKRLIIIAIEVIIVVIIGNLIPSITVTNYITWVLQAVIIAIISSIVVITINCLIYKEDLNGILNIIKRILKVQKTEKNKNIIDNK